MTKLCLNSRDELVILNLDKIAYFRADGNYTVFQYIASDPKMLNIGISKVEEYIKSVWPEESPSPFIRLGRSLIINQTYLAGINILRQQLTLSDSENHNLQLQVSRNLLKEYKSKISEHYF